MPKINVYLPDDLAAAVKAAGFPVSPVCQRALADAVRSVTQSRMMIKVIRDPASDEPRLRQIITDSRSPLTMRLHRVLEGAASAVTNARAGTGELLLGLLGEEGNLGVRILRALEVDLDDLQAGLNQILATALAADEITADRTGREAAGRAVTGTSADGEPSLLDGLTMSARNAVAAAIEAAVDLGHNYVGCEHLLLALASDQDTVAGRALRDAHLQAADVRRALTAALAGYVHARQATSAIALSAHDDIVRRLEMLETRLAALGG